MVARGDKTWLTLAAVWFTAGALLYVQLLLSTPTELTWRHFTLGAYTQGTRALLWMGLTPVVFALRRHLPIASARWWWTLPAHMLFALCLAWCVSAVRLVGQRLLPTAWDMPPFPIAELLGSAAPRMLIDVQLYWFVYGAASLAELYRESQEARTLSLRLQAQLAEAELRALKQQVQPHFLFNSLHAIAALVRAGRDAEAVHTIAQLSTLQRVLLENSGLQEITVAREFDFVSRYLEVERIRFGPKLVTEVTLETTARHALVPNLLLQPLVENAIKHGIACRSAPGKITVSAKIQHRRLHLVIINDQPEDGGEPAAGTGLGLRQTRERLERAYGADHRFEFDAAHAAGVRVAIELPARFAPDPAI